MTRVQKGQPQLPLIFERSVPGRSHGYLPKEDLGEGLEGVKLRQTRPSLPEISEIELGRHYTALEQRTYGINHGPYLLGSCTMKYNPRLNERMAGLEGFWRLHPLQPEAKSQGALAVYAEAAMRLNEITGMDQMTFQPAAGSHGEYTGLLMIRAYHEDQAKGGPMERNEILIPDAAHGTNPASAAMAGFKVVNVPSSRTGAIDIEKLRSLVGPRTAGLMLTNPDTEGVFDTQIREITAMVHEAGGLCYYDGANLNAIMGIVKPGDMGFDVIHLNLHKTFSTPHGGGGPGACAVGVKACLAPYLPDDLVALERGAYRMVRPMGSIGRVRSFSGSFLVVLRALAYVMVLGREGVRETAQMAVLNANVLKAKLADLYPMSNDALCMHEFVMSLSKLKKETGVSAKDVAKALLDRGIHPPTMYFPMTVPEALMTEPTETEAPERLAQVIEAFREIYEVAHQDPEQLQEGPWTTPIRRPDEVKAAREPILRWR